VTSTNSLKISGLHNLNRFTICAAFVHYMLNVCFAQFSYMSTGRHDQPKRLTTDSVRGKPMSRSGRVSWRGQKMYFSQNSAPIQRIFDLTNACCFPAACRTRSKGRNKTNRLYLPRFFCWAVFPQTICFIYVIHVFNLLIITADPCLSGVNRL
jgi:hypothetical protein